MAERGSRSEGGKAGWRGGAAHPGKRGPSAGRKVFGWATKRDRQYERAERRHRLRVAAGILLAAALIGYFCWLVIRSFLPTPFLAAVVTDYPAPVPPNAWAQEDIERFAAWKKEAKPELTYTGISWKSKEDGLEDLERQLKSVRPGGPDKNVVIIYLSMHGVVDADGEPCLLPPRPSRFASSTWLPVRDVLGRLKSRPDVKRVLILDSNRMDQNWSLGLLYNGFADGLKAVVSKAEDPNLWVLNSASPGQIGHAAPELGGSVFGYHVWRALGGEADGNHDDEVSLRELRDYLQKSVREWVTVNRSDVQKPMLLGSDADFPLIHAKKRSVVPPAPLDLRSDPRWEDVAKLWEAHRGLTDRAVYRLRPLSWEEFQCKLLRLEELLLAGEAYRDDYRTTLDESQRLADDLAKDPSYPDLAAYSLPLALRFRAAPGVDQQRQTLLAYLKQPEEKPPAGAKPSSSEGAAGPEAKPKETQPGAKPGGKPPGGEKKPQPAGKGDEAAKPKVKLEALRPYSYVAASAAAWQWFLEDPSREKFSRLFALVRGADRKLKTDVIETHFLGMLESHLRPEVASGDVQQALLARDAAERAAAPGDERVWYWIQRLVDEADQKRRQADDRLFVGNSDALSEARGLWTQVAGTDGNGGEYKVARDRAIDVAEAFKLRDEAWAEIPYLAQWIMGRRHLETEAERETDAEREEEDLRQLIKAAHDLSEQLDEQFRRGRWDVEALEEARTVVRDKLKALKEDGFDKEWDRLLNKAGEDKKTLRDIATVLALPLVTGDVRNRLRDKLLRIAFREAAAGRPSAGTETAGGKARAAPPSDAGLPRLDRLRRWDRHPALTVLSRSTLDPEQTGADLSPLSSASPLDKPISPEDRPKLLKLLGRQGEEVRGRLKATGADAGRWLATTTSLLEQGQPAALTRTECSKADRLVRASAPLLGDPQGDRGADAPAERLRRLDLHYLLLWHCRRTLDDYYGSAAGRAPGDETRGGPATQGQTPFFQIVARHYLDSARALCPKAAALVDGGVDLEERLRLRAGAARQGIRLDAEKLTVFEEYEWLPHQLSVELKEGQPWGEAAVYLQRPDDGRPLHLANDREQPLRRIPLSVDPARGTPDPLKYRVGNDALLADLFQCEAVTLYRGHVYSYPFDVVPSKPGREYVWEPSPQPKPKVTVFGEVSKPVLVMFILDCSGSMKEPTVGPDGTPTTRHEVAKEQLKSILLSLATSDVPYHVGLRAYGHRVTWWDLDGDGRFEEVIRDPNDPDGKTFLPKPPELSGVHPWNDVQLIWPLGRFQRLDFERWRPKLDALRYAGETPLYLAILQSMDDLERYPSDVGEKHIVAITDGCNYQSKEPTPRRRVETALRQNPQTYLDVVAFQFTPKDDFERDGQRALEELDRLPNAKFTNTNDPTDLLNRLKESLALSQYVVLPTRGTPSVTPEPIDLGQSWVLEDHPAGRMVQYEVRVKDPERPAEIRIPLVDGDAPALEVREQRRGGPRRLVYRRYEKDVEDSCRSRDPATGEEYVIRAHMPKREGAAMLFPLSVQASDEGQFSPRPAEAWVQIEPVRLDGSNAGPVYVFPESDLEPGLEGPVLQCRAENWPQEAKRAKIELWCKLWRNPDLRQEEAKTPPDKWLSVADLSQGSPKLDGAPGVTFRLQESDPAEVKILEQHPAGGDLYAVKVEMIPPPRKIVRRVYVDAGIVRHTFSYDGPVDRNRYRILLTTRESLEKQAIATDKPLEATVAR